MTTVIAKSPFESLVELLVSSTLWAPLFNCTTVLWNLFVNQPIHHPAAPVPIFSFNVSVFCHMKASSLLVTDWLIGSTDFCPSLCNDGSFVSNDDNQYKSYIAIVIDNCAGEAHLFPIARQPNVEL